MDSADIEIAEILGLATDGEGVRIGLIPYRHSPEIIDFKIGQRNQVIAQKFKQKAKDFSGPLPPVVRGLLHELLLESDEYKQALKDVGKLSRDLIEVEVTTDILNDFKESGGHAEYEAAKKRVEQADAILSIDPKLAERTGRIRFHIDAEVYKRSGDYHTDKEYISEVKKRIGNVDKMEMDNLRKKLMQTKIYSPTMRRFAPIYNPTIHTDDQQGYLNYILNTQPEVFESLASKSLPASIQENDRRRHTYIVGGTGSGKSELIKVIAHSYTEESNNSAVVVIDPHGDLTKQIAEWRCFVGNDRLVYLDPLLDPTTEQCFTINPLQPPKDSTPQDREVIAQQITGAFEELLKGSAGASLSVNMRAVLMPCILVLLDEGDRSLVDLQTFLNDSHNDQLVALGKKSDREPIAQFFAREFHDKNFSITKQSLRTKLQSLFNSGVFYRLVNGRTSIDLEQAIEQRKIILLNLSKGTVGNDASEALGRFVLALIQGMALRRQSIDASERVPVHVFIDECQNYIGSSTVTILEEARKYGVHLTLAQQVAGRGMSPEIRTVVLNNTAVKMVGRTAEDQRMAKLLGLDLADVQGLEVGHFYAKAGNNPTFRFKAMTHLLDDAYSMEESEWETLRESQLSAHYPARIATKAKAADIELE